MLSNNSGCRAQVRTIIRLEVETIALFIVRPLLGTHKVSISNAACTFFGHWSVDSFSALENPFNLNVKHVAMCFSVIRRGGKREAIDGIQMRITTIHQKLETLCVGFLSALRFSNPECSCLTDTQALNVFPSHRSRSGKQ